MSEFPIGVGPQHEGETVRKSDIQVELGGAKSTGSNR